MFRTPFHVLSLPGDTNLVSYLHNYVDLQVLYYSYALLGMQLFSGSIEYNTDNNTNRFVFIKG